MLRSCPAKVNSRPAAPGRPSHPDDARDSRVSGLIDDLFRARERRSPDRVRSIVNQLQAIDPAIASAILAATAQAVCS